MTNEPSPLAAWLPSAEIRAGADRIYYEHQSINIAPITDWLAGQHGGANPRPDTAVELFSGALYDFAQLCEEIRFQVGVGALYLAALQAEIDAARPNSPFANVGVPVSALALLTPYMVPNPAPSELLINPGLGLAGHRVLGGWWAGQLFDSALIRCMSAMDRLAALLHIAAGLATSPDEMPAFRYRWLNKIECWRDRPEWDVLTGMLRNPVFEYVKRYRDGFIHQQRSPSVLHGGHAVSAGVGAGATKGLPGDLHMAMGRGFFEKVLRPSTELVAQLLQSDQPPPRGDGD